jgi:hypothetical protein
MSETAEGIERIKRDALRILRSNDMGVFTAPTRNGLYPAQWNWDSGFVALALARMGDRPRAWLEIRSLLSAQWRGGMVPHIVFHVDDSSYFPNSKVWLAGESIPSSGITQPPVLGTFVRLMLDEGFGSEDLDALTELFPKLLAYHRWYHEVRDPQSTGLVTIVHPWESGFDNNPVFDQALRNVPLGELEPYERKDIQHASADQRPVRADYNGFIALLQLFRRHGYDQEWMVRNAPFRVAEVGVNALLLRADRDLRHLASIAKRNDLVPEIDRWIARGSDGLQRLWTPELGMFCPYDQVANRPIHLPSVTGFAPLFSGPLPSGEVSTIARTIERWLAGTSFGLPSFDPDHPLFDTRRYCRGPSWFVWGWIVAEGLSYNGRDDLGRRIRERFIDLAERVGFFEYYDPHTGEGYGGTDFSWTASVAILFGSDAKRTS